MNIITKAKALTDNLMDEVQKRGGSDQVEETQKLVTLTTNALIELQHFERGYQFEDNSEEIEYFKKHKSLIYAMYFFYDQRTRWNSISLFKMEDDLARYFKEQKDVLEREYLKEENLYRYFLSDETHLDELYFLNDGIKAKAGMSPNDLESYEVKKGRLSALLQLIEYVNGKIKVTDVTIDNSILQWTASPTALIELIYALYLTGVFNKGDAPLKKIADVLTNFFQIDIKNFSQVVTKIKMRKNDSQTFFLDSLRKTMQDHFDND